MKFIDVLITNTKNESMDFLWKYVGSDERGRYSIQKPKYILSGLSLDSNPKVGEIIFPNGFAVQYDENKMAELLDAIIESLDRTVGKIFKIYDVNTEIEEPVVDGRDEEDNEESDNEEGDGVTTEEKDDTEE